MVLHIYDPEAADKAREQGRSELPNLFRKGTFMDFCWRAGIGHDPRSLEELHSAWLDTEAPR